MIEPLLHRIEKLIDTYFAHLPRRKPETADKSVRLVAHRGAHDHALAIHENTHAAFKRALDLGCEGIEFDIHASKDGVIVVNHDPTLKRLWGHDVAISALRFDELRTLVPQLPSLAEVVTKYGKRMHLFIELKAPFVAVQELANTLKDLTPSKDYHLLCLDEAVLPTLTLFPKESLLLVPVHNNVNQFCKISLQQQYGGILGHYLLLSNRQIKRLVTVNQLAGVGFVDSKLSLYRELNRGINLLFTNNAATVALSLQELRKSKINRVKHL